VTALLRAESLSKRFSAGGSLFPGSQKWVYAVRDVSLEIARGTTLGLVGESGCGKSTLGRLLIKLITPTSGRVFLGDVEVTALEGAALRKLRRRMQMIFQDPYGALDPRIAIGEAVGEGLDIHHATLTPAERGERIASLLARVGIRADQIDRRPSEFSGGQRQRIVIARALAVEPELIVADEPVSALDVSIQAQVVNLLSELQRERGLTYLFVSHDLRIVEHVSDEVAVMYLGRIVERAPKRTLFATPRHPYTKALLSAVPGRGRERVLLEGDVPSPLDPPPGCAFHTRCPLFKTLSVDQQTLCRAETPSLRVLDDTHCACHFA